MERNARAKCPPPIGVLETQKFIILSNLLRHSYSSDCCFVHGSTLSMYVAVGYSRSSILTDMIGIGLTAQMFWTWRLQRN